MKREQGKGAGGSGPGGVCLPGQNDQQKSRESVIANLVIFVALVGVIRATPYILEVL
ncbi:unnamed protein product [Phyllotreta striolata]|uniref:Uncharacterized protein n=1 Tax=Phyllotreta striolata TaxID=444603 RepID=A0A9N9TVP6_PHYSR|nr:unnamed protein product [Phyllotreta striolata]